MAEPELFALMDQVIAAWVTVDNARRAAREAGQIERAISLNLALHSLGDGALALDELLKAEGTPIPAARCGPKGGLRVAA